MALTDRTPRGREPEARRNDERILEAAAAVFDDDPAAPMSAVARRAGVGQASLYRRYPSKQDLAAAVGRSGLGAIVDALQRALAADEPWTGLAEFLQWYASSGTLRTKTLLGWYDPPTELFDLAHRANVDMQALVDRAIDTGQLRPEVTGADLTMIATQLAAVSGDTPARVSELRGRYLALALQGLAGTAGAPLPGPAPSADELEAPWLATHSVRRKLGPDLS